MEFYIHKNGEQLGPFAEKVVRANLQTGVFADDDLAFQDGFEQWVPLGQLFSAARPTPVPVAPTPPTTGEVKTNVKQGALIGGFACFALGIAFMFISLWTFIVYGPLLLVAFVLSVVAMSQRRIIGGLILLLATLVAPAIIWLALAAHRTQEFAAKISEDHPSESTVAKRTDPAPETNPVDSPAPSEKVESPVEPAEAAPVAAVSPTNEEPDNFQATSVAEAQQEAIRRYPDLAREGSPLHVQFLAMIPQLKTSEPNLLVNPNWPVILAGRAAAALDGTVPRVAEPAANAQASGTAKPARSDSGIEPIEGAFGKRLGDVFDPAAAIGKAALTDGTPMYEFNPAKPFRSFTKYYVLITPLTHRIYSIWGTGPSENTETAKNEQALIMELLKQKYGASEKAGFMDALSDMKLITHGDRTVLTKINGFMDVTLEVRYQAADLTKLAEKERLQVEGKKVDPTGL